MFWVFFNREGHFTHFSLHKPLFPTVSAEWKGHSVIKNRPKHKNKAKNTLKMVTTKHPRNGDYSCVNGIEHYIPKDSAVNTESVFIK